MRDGRVKAGTIRERKFSEKTRSDVEENWKSRKQVREREREKERDMERERTKASGIHSQAGKRKQERCMKRKETK